MTHHNGLAQALGLSQGDTPFPWQDKLLTRFGHGNIPAAVDIPTGLGKTAVMAIWLVARAQGAKLPRRLVYVVDRRAVVDQATTEAERLRGWVEANDNIKKALGLTGPLPISTLRGQHVDNRQWLEDPASPAIIVGTVDMVGSRLLFEGYGVSRKMRPYHAGLLGTDTLVVLDEAHLVPPFEKLLEAIASGTSAFGPAGTDCPIPAPPFRLMPLSATGRGLGSDTHGLTDEDLDHPVLKKRIDATKRLILKPLEKGALVDALAHEAWALAESGRQGARIIVFCDKREVAGKVKSAVEKLAASDRKTGRQQSGIDTELFVGGRRVFERGQARQRLEQLGFLAGSKAAREKPAFLFATSAAEVGVDLDADHMVCDLVAWERMVQRLGRVNRRGEGDAKVIVVVEPAPTPDKKQKEAIDKKKCQAPFERLPKDDRGFDVSPGALRQLKLDAARDPDLKRTLDDATTTAPLRPALTRALVDAWSMTSLERHTGRPAIDPWLRGWAEDDPPQTAVIWRKYLPTRSGGTEPAKKDTEAFFEAAPPHTSEVLETETFRMVDWLCERAQRLDRAAKGDKELPGRDDIAAFVLARDGKLRCTIKLGKLVGIDRKGKDQLRSDLAGATLIIDARLAGLKDGLLENEENSPPRTADDGGDWLKKGVVRFRVRPAAAGEAALADPDWRERLRFAADVSEEGETHRWLIVDKWRHDAATEEDRSTARPQLLDEHQSWAEQQARELAKRLGLDADYEEMLAVAARLHDEGKRARRWQRAFNAPADGTYAKTKGPINYALLDGYRHELGSLPRAQSHEQLKSLPGGLQELALHLIAAHHGFGRPVIGTNGCEDAPPSAVEERAREVALRFARLQRRWGPWGLAWWEALLRAADQQASRENDAPRKSAAKSEEV